MINFLICKSDSLGYLCSQRVGAVVGFQPKSEATAMSCERCIYLIYLRLRLMVQHRVGLVVVPHALDDSSIQQSPFHPYVFVSAITGEG